VARAPSTHGLRTASTGAAAAAAYLFLVHRFWFVTDDAFISFRYASNWARGLGLRYNPGDHTPVEGYSNFLWVVVCGGMERLGLSPVLWAPIISLMAGGLLLHRVHQVARDSLGLSGIARLWAVASLALLPPYALWSTGGLATMPFALCLFCLFQWLLYGTRQEAIYKAGVVSLITSLLRAEGILWVAGIFAISLISRRRRPLPGRPLLYTALLVLLGFGLFLCWRYSYYGRWLPNTIHARAGLSLPMLGRGFDYVAAFFLTFPSFFLLLRVQAYRPRGLPLLVCAWASVAYAIAVGGDFMAMGRFLVPAFPLMALCGGVLLDHLLSRVSSRSGRVALCTGAGLLILCNLLPGWDVHLLPRDVRAHFHFRLNKDRWHSEHQQWSFMKDNVRRWERLGKALRRYAVPGESLVVGATGCVGYYSGLRIFDRFGLVDPRASSRPTGARLRSPGHDKAVPPDYFLQHEPTYIWPVLLRGEEVSSRITEVARLLLASSAEVQYLPRIKVFGRGGEREVLLLLKRPRRGESREEGLRQFQRAVQQLAGDPRL